jgi:transcriptional repressor NrdR
MWCAYCNNKETKVIDKRDVGSVTRRRRECLSCGKRFTTREALEEVELRVIKKDGRRESFDREKLRRGILKACEKRPVSAEQIERMIANIEEKLRKNGREVKTLTIGELTARELKKEDKIAYIRFASVYKDFTDLADFKKEIKELVNK